MHESLKTSQSWLWLEELCMMIYRSYLLEKEQGEPTYNGYCGASEPTVSIDYRLSAIDVTFNNYCFT
jgi:hypothetical protein